MTNFLPVLLFLLGLYFQAHATGFAQEGKQQAAATIFYNELAWSPDGSRLSFSAMKEKTWDIYTMRADGSLLKNLTASPEMDFGAAWSPDGKRIVFGSKRGGDKNDLYLMSADGGGSVRQLTRDSGNNSAPTFSPDGRKIAFTSDRDGQLQIYTMNADGSAQTRITADAVKHFSPSWSPDGKRILFYTEKGDRKDQLYLINPDGSGLKLLTGGVGHNFAPSWSPDGKRILFSSIRDDSAQATGADVAIYTMRADGTDLKKLPFSGRAFFARYSPDGKRIAVIAGKYPESAIYLVKPDGTIILRLTK